MAGLLDTVKNAGCDEIWCPTETQIGTEWFPWTTGSIDWGSAIGSDKNAQNAQTLFILFVIQLQFRSFQQLLVVSIVAAVTVKLLTRNKMSLVAVVLQPLS